MHAAAASEPPVSLKAHAAATTLHTVNVFMTCYHILLQMKSYPVPLYLSDTRRVYASQTVSPSDRICLYLVSGEITEVSRVTRVTKRCVFLSEGALQSTFPSPALQKEQLYISILQMQPYRKEYKRRKCEVITCAIIQVFIE